MLPRSSSHHIGDRHVVDAVLRGQGGSARSTSRRIADCAHVGGGECGAARVAILRPHIDAVVSVGTEEEVFGANTRPVVAAVQNVETARDGAVRQCPRAAVGETFLIKLGGGLPVPVPVTASDPHPTRAEFRSHGGAALVNVTPEPIGGATFGTFPTNDAVAGSAAVAIRIGRPRGEASAAAGAVACGSVRAHFASSGRVPRPRWFQPRGGTSASWIVPTFQVGGLL